MTAKNLFDYNMIWSGFAKSLPVQPLNQKRVDQKIWRTLRRSAGLTNNRCH